MYVEKIEIPAFRVLRDVVLEFGEVYDPQIFPVGSENGGGKSTLLQLIFTLLHCSAAPRQHPYLANLLASDFYVGEEDERVIARLTVRIQGELHVLEFVALHDRILGHKLDSPPQFGFGTKAELRKHQHALDEAKSRLEMLMRFGERYPASMKGDIEISFPEVKEVRLLLGDELLRVPRSLQEIRARLQQAGPRWQQTAEGIEAAIEGLAVDAERVQGLLIALNYHFITTYLCPTPKGGEMRALICRVPGESASKAEKLLAVVATKVFLLGPSNQQYLFLGKDARKALLGATARSGEAAKARPQIEYMTRLDEAEATMAGFYAYDWLSVKPLVQLFAAARDEDFKSVVTTGEYGDNYTNLMREVNGLLLGKKVRPLGDLAGVEFIVTDANGHETPLSPEDLSQGELKRLLIYAWLRANNAVDALVLIDEIETSFHPDWQVGIVRDLQDWAPKNQYILATHSYELCQALTPRHVRELQPRLRRGEVAEGVAGKDSRDG